MADILVDLKLTELCLLGHDWLRQRWSSTAVAGTPTEILTSAASGGPYNNCGVPGAKSFRCHQVTVVQRLSLGTANPYYVRFAPNGTTSFWRMQCLKRQHSFPLDKTMMSWVMQLLVEMEQINYTFCRSCRCRF
jgi:hypothetical protein